MARETNTVSYLKQVILYNFGNGLKKARSLPTQTIYAMNRARLHVLRLLACSMT